MGAPALAKALGHGCLRAFPCCSPYLPAPCSSPAARCAGTVIPAQDSAFVTDDLLAFKRRPAPPTGGEGRFVCGPFQGALLGPGASVTLTNAQGTVVAST